MMKSVVIYQGNCLLGEVEIYYNPNNNYHHQIKNKNLEIIKINHFSQPSERCTPLAVLHTIASPFGGLCFKLESTTTKSQSSELFSLHSSCLRENKTAVMTLGEEELHLVAMPSRRNLEQFSCFWGFIVAPGLYNSCLNMLNLRCLGIVFDLDETLVVANTMRSFEDRIDSLQRKLNIEMDPQRISGMLAEIKRYQDDKIILKQYVENDQVVENGKVIKVQSELVPALSEDHQPIVRPLIRLREKNIILTRINPLIRDTSVLVRLRPAWEELRSYLTARGRKRFEVYVCTMAERDYALEMWRLLDPESNLINSKQLLDRIVCVKAGSRKSLLNVFHDGICHPKMALVIDDRLKVWDEKDQPRVHVVPAFAPYYAPQAEANNVIPVLCVARNVACNVRGGFFKDFDDGLLQKIPEVSYEDDLENIPSAPDVSNYLISEDDNAASSKDPLGFDGMADAEVERRLKDAISSSETTTLDPRHIASLQPAVASLLSSILQPTAGVMPFPLATSSIKPVSTVGPVEPSLQCSPAREEGEVPESELDPDTRRRLLILQHGQDTRDQTSSEPPVPVRPPIPVSIPPAHQGDDRFRPNHPRFKKRSFPAEEMPLDPTVSSIEEHPAQVLQTIARKCRTMVEFRSSLISTTELQFSIEVWFTGEKVGEGVGRTRKEAQYQAAEHALRNLANKYLSNASSDPISAHEDLSKLLYPKGNGFLGESNSSGYETPPMEDFVQISGKSEPFKRSTSSLSALKELCTVEGLPLVFQDHSPLPTNSMLGEEFHAQVEIGGQVLGSGVGPTWDEAKMRAAEEALQSLKSMTGQGAQNHADASRFSHVLSGKRQKLEFPRVLQRMPSSLKYANNTFPVS
ncbi:Rna polymerase ii c-terminal domain phosphatase-like [Thalictrum thalictroides]|uniref:protein-serine/threonine phosphatase n=1 Tax=Thalictrum thalictroides TaxID=46969 RepID=A0A7J6V5A2_THATH|nr:Rna polymerase ii c-terminal domain phosphatase-like [Thalictrum thalictroides]